MPRRTVARIKKYRTERGAIRAALRMTERHPDKKFRSAVCPTDPFYWWSVAMIREDGSLAYMRDR